jgi:hypothetical protein
MEEFLPNRKGGFPGIIPDQVIFISINSPNPVLTYLAYENICLPDY